MHCRMHSFIRLGSPAIAAAAADDDDDGGLMMALVVVWRCIRLFIELKCVTHTHADRQHRTHDVPTTVIHPLSRCLSHTRQTVQSV